MSAECPHNAPVAAGAQSEQTQNKTAAPEGTRHGGDLFANGAEKPNAPSNYTASARKPRDASEVRRLRTLLLHAINEDADLTPHSRIVGVFLCGLVNIHTEQAWPSADHISARLGISKRTVYRAIAQLEHRYFRVTRSKGRSNSNIYVPIWPPEHLDPQRLGELRTRVIAAEAQDNHAASCAASDAVTFDPADQVISGTSADIAAPSEPQKGDNGRTEKVTETAPNLVEGNINTGARARPLEPPAHAEPSERLLSEEGERAAPAPLDALEVKRAFKAKFGLEAYRAHFANVRLSGDTAVVPSIFNADKLHRFHAFMKRQGVRFITVEDKPGWRHELVPSRISAGLGQHQPPARSSHVGHTTERGLGPS
ncbi:MAG: helix-turn-helix domain-containing protein [Oceanicaulis sp.]|nr:helix-turn-helix domain-containing protein [Oceanicaulis sp.]